MMLGGSGATDVRTVIGAAAWIRELKRKSGCREKGVRTRIGDLVSIDDLAAQPNL